MEPEFGLVTTGWKNRALNDKQRFQQQVVERQIEFTGREKAMSNINSTQTLGAIVTEFPALARDLERYGLDYCCHGQRTLSDACAEKGLDADEVARALNSLDGGTAQAWTGLSFGDLSSHVEAVHHVYLWDEMPRLAALAAKVAEVHGPNHPELAQVRDIFFEVKAALEPHLTLEEQVIFPMIRGVSGGHGTTEANLEDLDARIEKLKAEHVELGDQLDKLQEITNGYQVPPDGCASYQALYMGLKQLEDDTHLHIHKENNVMFPAVLAIKAGAV